MNLIEMRLAVMQMAVQLNEGKNATMKEVYDTYDSIIQKLTEDLVKEPTPEYAGTANPLAQA